AWDSRISFTRSPAHYNLAKWWALGIVAIGCRAVRICQHQHNDIIDRFLTVGQPRIIEATDARGFAFSGYVKIAPALDIPIHVFQWLTHCESYFSTVLSLLRKETSEL